MEGSSKARHSLSTEEEYSVSRCHPYLEEECTVSTFHPHLEEECTVSTFHSHPVPPTKICTPRNTSTSYYRSDQIRVMRQNTYGQYLVDVQREKMGKKRREDEDILWDCLKKAILERRRKLRVDELESEWD